MGEQDPCVQRLRLRGRVEHTPLDRSTVEGTALALRPVTDLRCSTGAASSSIQQPLEVEREVAGTTHHSRHLLWRGSVDLRQNAAVATLTRHLTMPVPAA